MNFLKAILTCLFCLSIFAQEGKEITIPVLHEKSSLESLEKYSKAIGKVTNRIPREQLNLFAKAFFSIPLHRALKHGSLDIIAENKYLFRELITRTPLDYNLSHSSDTTRLWLKIIEGYTYEEIQRFIWYNYSSPLVLELPNIADFLINNLNEAFQSEKAMIFAMKYGYNVNQTRQYYLNEMLKSETELISRMLSPRTNEIELITKNLKWIKTSIIESIIISPYLKPDALVAFISSIYKDQPSLIKNIVEKNPNKILEVIIKNYQSEYQLTDSESAGIIPEKEVQKRRLKLSKKTAKLINKYIADSKPSTHWFVQNLFKDHTSIEARIALLRQVYPLIEPTHPEIINFNQFIINYEAKNQFMNDSLKLEVIKVFIDNKALPAYKTYKNSVFMIELKDSFTNYMKYLLMNKQRPCNFLLQSN